MSLFARYKTFFFSAFFKYVKPFLLKLPISTKFKRKLGKIYRKIVGFFGAELQQEDNWQPFIHTGKTITTLSSFAQQLSSLEVEHSDKEKALLAVIIYQQSVKSGGELFYDALCILVSDINALNTALKASIDLEKLANLYPQAVKITCANLMDIIRPMAKKAPYLYVTVSGVSLSGDGIFGLLKPLKDDPMVGSVVPRANGVTDTDNQNSFLKFKKNIAEYFARPMTDNVSAILLRSRVILNYLPVGVEYTQALYLFFAQINRKGFCVAVSNVVYASLTNVSEIDKGQFNIEAAKAFLLSRGCAEVARWGKSLYKTGEELKVKLIAQACSVEAPYLIDLTGLRLAHNGTSKLSLAFLDAAKSLSHKNLNWVVWTNTRCIEFFSLKERYPDFTIIDNIHNQYFKLAFKLGQPWNLQHCYKLARHAYFNFYLMQDTITYDCLYLRTSDELRATWEFVANFSDGIIFNSQFTGDHFKRRFPCYRQPAPAYLVARPSLCASDYVAQTIIDKESKEACQNILIIGNKFSHKNIEEVLATLPQLFPAQHFKILGLSQFKKVQQSNVSVVASGDLTDSKVDEMYRWADIVVYPSSFEGFGFPIFQGLSYGKCVFAQSSVLNEECLSLYRGRGVFVGFDSFAQLIERLRGYIDRVERGGEALFFERVFASGRSSHDFQAMFAMIVEFLNQHSEIDDGLLFHQRMAGVLRSGEAVFSGLVRG